MNYKDNIYGKSLYSTSLSILTHYTPLVTFSNEIGLRLILKI